MTLPIAIQQFEQEVTRFQAIIDIQFNNINLLREALTHRSATKVIKHLDYGHNERLEFLGDAILKTIISKYLFESLPDSNEGKLTKIRAHIVSDKFLHKLSLLIDMGSFMLFSPGEIQTGGKKRQSNLANAFEALLGAIYLDQGLETTTTFFLSLFKKIERELDDYEQKDYKSILQEYSQKEYKTLPEYTLAKETGPEHNKRFHVVLKLPKSKEFTGIGNSKKVAEQQAAYYAVQWLNSQ